MSQSRDEVASKGKACCDSARTGVARRVMVGYDPVWFGRPRQGEVRPGVLRCGRAGLGMAGCGEVWCGTGMPRLGWVRPGVAWQIERPLLSAAALAAAD